MKKRTIATLQLDGGCACLNLVNTVHSRTEEPRFDYLRAYDDVLEWAVHAGVLGVAHRRRLRKEAQRHPRRAKAAFDSIIEARELLYRLFAALAADRAPAAGDLASFNAYLSRALSRLLLVQRAGQWIDTWPDENGDLLRPLWVVIKSAYEVLLHVPATRIKSCPACAWLFLDSTKNNKRRWCNPQSCGSIDKASRYYYRKKTQA